MKPNIYLLFVIFIIQFNSAFPSAREANSFTLKPRIMNHSFVANKTSIIPRKMGVSLIDEIILWEEDFENNADGWSASSGWQLTTDEYNSSTHSMNSPNDVSTLNGSWNLLSPTIEVPELGDGETMNFGFFLKSDMPDKTQTDDPSTNEDESSHLADYYNISIMDIDALAWHASSTDAYDGNSYWCGDEEVGGYLDSWVQFLDTPPFTVPSGGTLTADMMWKIEAPSGASGSVPETCTDGWDAANVRISKDGGETWELLNGSVEYDFDCGYGWIWNDAEYNAGGSMDHLAAGWGGSQDWINISFDLGSYVGQEVIARFAFGSDPAYCTLDDSSITGFHVDSIVVSGILDCSPETNCNTNVSGAVWVDQFYDYCDVDRPGYQAWEEYAPGIAFNGNVLMDISDFAGKGIIFRIQSRYDDNNDGGFGDGLFIDDIKIYKISGGNYPAPIGLSAEPGDGQATLSWYDMNASGTDNFVYHNSSFTEDGAISLTDEGIAWAGERFDLFGPSVVDIIQIISINANPVDVTVGSFGQLGTLFNTESMYSIDVTLQPGENTFDVSWNMHNSFIIGYTFSDSIIAGLDTSPVSENSMVMLDGGWDPWSIYETDIIPGEWGVSANITYAGAGVSYNLYRDGAVAASGITSNSHTDTVLTNNTTYEYTLTATYSDGEESGESNTITVTPFANTVHEEGYDDGSFEGGVCTDAQFANQDSCLANDESWEYGFNVGSGNFSAVRIFAQPNGENLEFYKWFQHGSGGAFYIKVWDNAELFDDDGVDGEANTNDQGEDNGMYDVGEVFTDTNDNGVWDSNIGLPGNEIYSSVQAGSQDGWNETDLSGQEISVSDDFWIGTKEFSSTKPFGLDLSSVSGNSYQRIGSSGDWTAVSGNLGYHILLNCGDNCDDMAIKTGIVPHEFGINNIFPNPFNPIANIQFTISQISQTKLSIYDLNGRLVNILVDDMLNPGHYISVWSAVDRKGYQVSSGIYLSVLEAQGREIQTRKLVLLK